MACDEIFTVPILSRFQVLRLAESSKLFIVQPIQPQFGANVEEGAPQNGGWATSAGLDFARDLESMITQPFLLQIGSDFDQLRPTSCLFH